MNEKRERPFATVSKALAKVNEAPWLLATGEDYRYPKRLAVSEFDDAVHAPLHGSRGPLATRSVEVRRCCLQGFQHAGPATRSFSHACCLSAVRGLQAVKPLQ